MKRFLYTLLALSLYVAPASAEEFVGIMAGPSIANLGLGLKAGFGFETAGKLDPHWSLGFHINFVKLGTNNGSSDGSTMTTFLGGVAYHAWETNQGPWAGIRAGIGVVNGSNAVNELATVGGSTNLFSAGIAVGFDKKIGAEWTWGPQGQVVMLKNDAGNLMVINALVSLRYWPE